MQFLEEKDYVEPRAAFKLKLKDQGDELFEAALMDEEIDIIKDYVQGPLEVRGLIKKNRLKWNKVPQGHIYRRGTEIVLRFIAYINNKDQLRNEWTELKTEIITKVEKFLEAVSTEREQSDPGLGSSRDFTGVQISMYQEKPPIMRRSSMSSSSSDEENPVEIPDILNQQTDQEFFRMAYSNQMSV